MLPEKSPSRKMPPRIKPAANKLRVKNVNFLNSIKFLLQSDTTYSSSSDLSTLDFLPAHETNVL